MATNGAFEFDFSTEVGQTLVIRLLVARVISLALIWYIAQEREQIHLISSTVYRSRNHEDKGAKVDSRSRPLRMGRDKFHRLFLEHDLDHSGRIDTFQEALQFVTKLSCSLQLDVDENEIELLV